YLVVTGFRQRGVLVERAIPDADAAVAIATGDTGVRLERITDGFAVGQPALDYSRAGAAHPHLSGDRSLLAAAVGNQIVEQVLETRSETILRNTGAEKSQVVSSKAI